jgi:hypothetical protein
MDPKLEFGLRLRAAMEAVGLAARPSVLLKLFNARYWGSSVTFQAVSRWLRGQAIPEQDKLLVLAEILRIEPEILRYGEGIRRSLLERQQRWDQSAGFLERETFDAFLQLPVEQRRLIRETVLLFNKANAEPEPQRPVAVSDKRAASPQVRLRASGSAAAGTPRRASVATGKARVQGAVTTEG